MAIEDVRVANLRFLIEYGGGQIQLSKRIDKGPAKISQWLNRAPDSRTGKPRTTHSTTARFIESKLKLLAN